MQTHSPRVPDGKGGKRYEFPISSIGSNTNARRTSLEPNVNVYRLGRGGRAFRQATACRM